MTVLILVVFVAVVSVAIVLLERADERERMNRRDSHEDWMD